MKKSLLWLMAISLIITGWLTYADNEFIVHDTTGWTITVYSQDKSYWITIQDKNLWATVVWTWTASYWYYFQWWNNHWNPWDSEKSDTLLVWDDSYNNNWYDGIETRYILKNSVGDIWADNQRHINLWWGWNDNEDSDATIVKWYDTINHVSTNVENRQWPCPEWYHVPSAGEWYELMMLRCSLNSDTCTGDVIQSYNLDWWEWKKLVKNWMWWDFSNDLLLPSPWLRVSDNNGNFVMNGNVSQYWSSTSSKTFLFFPKHYSPMQEIKVVNSASADAYPIRCFKNPDVFTVTFLDDGEVVTSWSVVSGGIWAETPPTLADREWYRFDYRYADGADDTTGFDFSAPITENLKLRSKWTLNTTIPNWIYTWLDWWDITIVWNDFTWWEINLTLAWENLPWGYYRWRSEPANNNWSSNRTDSAEHNNDWWGGTDTKENWFNPNPTNFEERQWPCQTWYHVPSRWEWNSLVIAWCNLDDECHGRYSDTQSWWVIWDLIKREDNKLIYINGSLWLWTRFKTAFNIASSEYDFWSTSPYTNSITYGSWYFEVSDNNIAPCANFFYGRSNNYNVRCFKNYIIPPQIFSVTFLNDREHVWSGNVVSWDKIPAEVISWYNLTWLTKTWYTFWWWTISWSDEIFDVENDVVTTWMTLNAVWQVNQYTITSKDWDNEITSITADYWTWIIPPVNPTKNGFTFKWWEPEVPATMPAENITINAKWDKTWGWSSGWWGGWGWWGSSSKTDTGSTSSGTWNQINSNTWDTASTWTNIKEPETNTGSNIQTWSQVDSNTGSIVSSWTNVNNPDTETSNDSTTSSQNDDKTYSTEFQQAYEFAKWNGITTMPTIQKANMEWKLTRIAMAKMLSQYAMNVLWQKPANIVTPKFNDVTDKMDTDYDDGVTLAYQLWIMWQNMPWNNFRPNDEVTRAEFATALSRMAYWTSDGEYKWTWKYYIHHMEKLVKEWIITKDDPNMKELRGYVMIMLMRSAK